MRNSKTSQFRKLAEAEAEAAAAVNKHSAQRVVFLVSGCFDGISLSPASRDGAIVSGGALLGIGADWR
jgi:hypothetical protein